MIQKKSRPYSIDRNGFILSEGGAIIVIASLDYAAKKNLNIYAEVLVTGMTDDAFHFTTPNNDSVKKSMEMAMELRPRSEIKLRLML